MIIEARDDVVRLEGKLDKNLWPTIQAAANLQLRQHVQGIIIDASGLVSCSPEGALTFRDAMDYIERYHARIVVASLPADVLETTRTVPGVRSRLPVAANIEEARASLSLAGSRRGQNPAVGRQLQDILVPIIGKMPPDIATSLACRIGKADPGPKPRIHLVYVLEVPRVLTLRAPLPEEEAIAARAIEHAEAIVRSEGLTAVTHVSRARDSGEEIVQQATQVSANIIVMAYIPSEEEGDLMERVARTLLTRAPCEVILNKSSAVLGIAAGSLGRPTA